MKYYIALKVKLDMQYCYILMADIIDSSHKVSTSLMNDFVMLIDKSNKKYCKQLLSPLTITLGDEFQGIVKSLKGAINIIIDLEKEQIHLKSNFKLRYVLQYGTVDTEINSKIAYQMLGEGLKDTRNNLIGLKKTNNRFLFALKKKKNEIVLNNSFVVCQNLIDKWHDEDKELIYTFLQEQDYKKVALKLGKETSLMWKREKSLRIKDFFALENIIESIAENE